MQASSYPSTKPFFKSPTYLLWGLSILMIGLFSCMGNVQADTNESALYIDEKGNLTIGTTTFIYQSGNVGIGTPTPGEALQLGSLQQKKDTYLKIATEGGSKYRAGIKLEAFTDNFGYTIEHDDRLEPRHGLKFTRNYLNDNTSASSTDLFLDFTSGNVGIGTMLPNSKLDVKGRIYAQQLAFTDADGNWYPDNWIGTADNNVAGSGKTPWLHIGGVTDKRKKENEKTGSVDGDGKRRIALYANTTYVADELIVENAITAKRVNGEKPPLVFEVGKKDDLGKWNAVEQDIGSLCGDADGCTMKFMLRDNGNDQVRTISEQMYIEQPDKSSNKRPGLQGWTRQLGGGETEFVLQTSAKQELVPHPWDWIYVRNYSSPEVGPKSGAYSGYKVQFMTAKNVAATVIIYDR